MGAGFIRLRPDPITAAVSLKPSPLTGAGLGGGDKIDKDSDSYQITLPLIPSASPEHVEGRQGGENELLGRLFTLAPYIKNKLFDEITSLLIYLELRVKT